MRKVKINSKNLISNQEINKENLKYTNKTVSLINKKIIILNPKRTSFNKLQKELNHKLISLSSKEIFILKNLINIRQKWNQMSISILMKRINKKSLNN